MRTYWFLLPPPSLPLNNLPIALFLTCLWFYKVGKALSDAQCYRKSVSSGLPVSECLITQISSVIAFACRSAVPSDSSNLGSRLYLTSLFSRKFLRL